MGKKKDPLVWYIESFQDFLIKLNMKPRMNLVEINNFSLNNVTVRPTKIMNRAEKNWAHLKKLSDSKIKIFKNIFY